MAIKHKDLKKVVKELKGASKMHLKQSKIIGKQMSWKEFQTLVEAGHPMGGATAG